MEQIDFSASPEDRLREALRTLVRRQRGAETPDGLWTDNGVWIPAPEELRECCIGKQLSSRRQYFLKHVRTAKHVAALWDVEHSALLAAEHHYRLTGTF